jgi:hypothetical protein
MYGCFGNSWDFGNTPRTNGTPKVVVQVGDDTDNTEYVIEDGEETLSENWKEDHPPDHTYL